MLEGSSGYSKGILVTGSIKKKEAITYTPGVNDITIPKGQYLNGNQVILGDTNLKPENIKSGVSLFGIHGTYTSDANASANQILSGKIAYVKGSKVTGTMANKSGATVEASTITSDDDYTYLIIPETGYYDTESKVKVENDKLNDNIGIQKLNLNIGLTTYQYINSWVDIDVKKYKNAEINITPNRLEIYYIDNSGQAKYINTLNAGVYTIDISDYNYIRFQSPTKSSSETSPARTIITGTLS